MVFETIELQKEGWVATITINRPPVNPLNSTFFKELYEALEEIDFDDQVRAVIITGQGEKAFSAGADIKEMEGLDPKGLNKMSHLSRRAFDRLEQLSKPVVAAINGVALGGGCELALACDLRISSDKARFSLPELSLGIIPGGGGTQRLQRVIGQSRAKELIYLGEMIDANQAYEYGLVNKVAAPEELMTIATEWANKMSEYSPVAMKMAKVSINQGGNVDKQTGLEIEAACSYIAFSSEDKKEGMAAFAEKRKPNFAGK